MFRAAYAEHLRTRTHFQTSHAHLRDTFHMHAKGTRKSTCEKVLCERLNYSLHWIRRDRNAMFELGQSKTSKQVWQRAERMRDAWETRQMHALHGSQLTQM